MLSFPSVTINKPMNKISILAGAATLIAPLTFVQANGFSYSYLEGTFHNYKDDEIDSGVEISGSLEVNDTVYLRGSYEQVNINDYGFDEELSATSIGIGAHTPLSHRTDGFVELSYIKTKYEFDYFNVSTNDSGFEVAGGLRHMVTPKLEAEGRLSHVSFDESDVDESALEAKARYHFTEQFSAGVGVHVNDDSNETVNSSIRFSSL